MMASVMLANADEWNANWRVECKWRVECWRMMASGMNDGEWNVGK